MSSHSSKLFGLRATDLPPVAPMWVAGGVDRERWMAHRFETGQLVEGAVRDGDSHARGTILLEIAAALSTDDEGHWVTAKFIGASDAHMQWWKAKGGDKKLASKCAYHFCEESSHDCKVTRRGASIHVEKFRVLTQKEIDGGVPAWAHEKEMSKSFHDYLEKRGMAPKPVEAKAVSPWASPGEEGSEDESEGSMEECPTKEGLKAKLLKARDEVKKLERELAGKKDATKGKRAAIEQEEARRKKKIALEEKGKKKEKKVKDSPSLGGVGRKRKATSGDPEHAKEARLAKKKKKGIDEPSSPSEEVVEEGLFGELAGAAERARAKEVRRDRGLFEGGGIVRIQGESVGEPEAGSRSAPAVPKAGVAVAVHHKGAVPPVPKAPPEEIGRRLPECGGVNPAKEEKVSPPGAVCGLHPGTVPWWGPSGDEISQEDEDIGHRAGPAGKQVGALAERLQRPERGQSPKKKSGEKRPEEKSERRRRRKRKGDREEELEPKTIASAPPQPPVAVVEGSLKGYLAEERTPVELFYGLWRTFEGKDTPLSRLAQWGKDQGAPLEDKSSKSVRGDELLPINPQAVIAYLQASGGPRAQGVAAMVCALNYLARPQGQGGWCAREVRKELTQSQKLTVDHLRRALDYMEVRKLRCGRFEETARHLAAVRFDYQGEPVVVMEDIRADKVIAAWPKMGQAAVQDALAFLPEKLKAKLLDPPSCLKPVHEWPAEPHKSRVRASDEEWNKVVQAAYERGLMVAVEVDDVFKDQKGRPVLNGAGAVKKEKKVDGKMISTQRFISNLIPSNMFQDRLEGDDKLLPYLGQLTLLEQEEEEVWLVDSEDFTSCFNLFRLPPVWHKFMAFDKPVDAALLGGEPGKAVYPAMAVLPMGWISSVAVVQSIVRSLVFKEADIPPESEVAKTQPLPAGDDLTVIYLDSYDQLRKFKKGCEEVVKADMSERHKRFLRVCEDLALPLNDGKRLVASTLGALQGGELDGEEGRYGLSVQKMVEVVTLGATLLAKEKWSEAELRHFVASGAPSSPSWRVCSEKSMRGPGTMIGRFLSQTPGMRLLSWSCSRRSCIRT